MKRQLKYIKQFLRTIYSSKINEHYNEHYKELNKVKSDVIVILNHLKLGYYQSGLFEASESLN